MTSDQMWSAIRDLDPAAEVCLEPPGGWSVRLHSVVHDLQDTSAVTSPRARSQRQAIERMWARLLSLSESSMLYRDRGPEEASGRYREVRWNGTEWVHTDR
jgi:hypothetical protein